jgi:pyruvate,orthophosphate dikinase
VVTAKIHYHVNNAKPKEKFILCTSMTTPEDVTHKGLLGIITRQGGFTSHAAIVARSRGIPCIVGVETLKPIDAESTITLDGNRGLVFEGKVKVLKRGDAPELLSILEWAEEHQGIGVYANADTPQEITQAISRGAEGIGLCRTEHMIAPTDRLRLLQKALLVPDESKRASYLLELYDHQKADFVDVLKASKGLPIIIRLLDAPMHEIMPSVDHYKAIAKDDFNGDIVELGKRLDQLREQNPMLGHRGVRLGVTIPDIYALQIQAIMVAAREVEDSKPHIMVPMVSIVQEFTAVQGLVLDIWQKMDEHLRVGARTIPVGAMIETPRAALTADEIAFHADFLSFGTNDMTQMSYGFSRDDIGRFLPEYKAKRILENDPFVTLDERGIGRLLRLSVEMVRKVDPEIRIGVCGEHGGDPKSIALCAAMGMDYVSCSPARIQGAKLTVAQWTLRSGK